VRSNVEQNLLQSPARSVGTRAKAQTAVRCGLEQSKREGGKKRRKSSRQVIAAKQLKIKYHPPHYCQFGVSLPLLHACAPLYVPHVYKHTHTELMKQASQQGGKETTEKVIEG
jgi:hypothetical protein